MKKFFVIISVLSGFWVSAQKPLTSNEQFHKSSGDVLVGVLPALALGSTFIWKDDQKGTLQFTKAFVSTVAITYALKLAIKKERPNGENFNAFPSGHTSISFASAGFLQKRYGWKVGAPAYALAGYVSYSRIKAEKHDKWDVLAGAIIGTGIAYLFSKPYNPKKDIKVTIGTFDNSPTIGVIYKF